MTGSGGTARTCCACQVARQPRRSHSGRGFVRRVRGHGDEQVVGAGKLREARLHDSQPSGIQVTVQVGMGPSGGSSECVPDLVARGVMTETEQVQRSTAAGGVVLVDGSVVVAVAPTVPGTRTSVEEVPRPERHRRQGAGSREGMEAQLAVVDGEDPIESNPHLPAEAVSQGRLADEPQLDQQGTGPRMGALQHLDEALVLVVAESALVAKHLADAWSGQGSGDVANDPADQRDEVVRTGPRRAGRYDLEHTGDTTAVQLSEHVAEGGGSQGPWEDHTMAGTSVGSGGPSSLVGRATALGVFRADSCMMGKPCGATELPCLDLPRPGLA